MIARESPTVNEQKRLRRTIVWMERSGAYLAAAVTRLGNARFCTSTATAGIYPHGADIELVFSREFFTNLSDRELAGVLLHEAMHFVFKHIPRAARIRNRHDQCLFRYACEAVINDIITRHHPTFALPGTPVTGPRLVGREVHDLSADQVVALLRKRLEDEPGFEKQLLLAIETDDHDLWQGPDEDTLGDGCPGWDAETDQLLTSLWSQFGGGEHYGHGALGRDRGFHRCPPRKNLRRFLLDQLRPPLRHRPDWSRANRKAAGIYPRVILPTWEALPNPKRVLMAMDTSGSIRRAFLDVVVSVAEQPLPECEVKLITFDVQCYPFEKGQTILSGGGGTLVQAVENYIHAAMTDYPDIVFVFTDGFTPAPCPRHPERWVWILTPEGSTKAIPPSSRVERFERDR